MKRNTGLLMAVGLCALIVILAFAILFDWFTIINEDVTVILYAVLVMAYSVFVLILNNTGLKK